jgi:hypothetical protein
VGGAKLGGGGRAFKGGDRIMKPVCVPCQRFFRPRKNGFYFIEAMPRTGRPLPGTQEPEGWTPYKLWAGDLYECEGCGAEIVVGTPPSPIAEHYQPDFDALVERLGARQLQVNDC